MIEEVDFQAKVEEAFRCDPSLKALVDTWRNQQRKTWSKIYLCLRPQMRELGIELFK
jgi:hypothetical protein